VTVAVFTGLLDRLQVVGGPLVPCILVGSVYLYVDAQQTLYIYEGTNTVTGVLQGVACCLSKYAG